MQNVSKFNGKYTMRHILVLLSIFLSVLTASSQVRFDYDVDYEMNFDNREFYRSDFSESMTIFRLFLPTALHISSW